MRGGRRFQGEIDSWEVCHGNALWGGCSLNRSLEGDWLLAKVTNMGIGKGNVFSIFILIN